MKKLSTRKGKGSVTIRAINKQESEQFAKCEVSRIQHSYPLKFLIPKYACETNCCWVYPISYGGGLVEGDEIEIDINVEENCAAVITTQESTKVFECNNNVMTKQVMRYSVKNGGLLCVLGDPVVCFKDAVFSQIQEVTMTHDSNLVLLDLVSAGRIARGECWQFTSFENKITVSVDGKLVLNEAHHLENTKDVMLKDSMKEYEIMGCCIVLGDDVDHLSKYLIEKYSRKQNIGERLTHETVCSVSPLQYEVTNKKISGCYLRFLSPVSKAHGIISDITRHLLPVIGNDPFYNKY